MTSSRRLPKSSNEPVQTVFDGAAVPGLHSHDSLPCQPLKRRTVRTSFYRQCYAKTPGFHVTKFVDETVTVYKLLKNLAKL